MHILHVVPGLGGGGMETTMARLISALSSAEMRHSIAFLKGKPEIKDCLPAEVPLYPLNAKPNEIQLPFRLGHLIRRLNPDVIHTRNWGAWPDMAVGRFFAWPLVPLIHSFHGLGETGFMPWRRRMASRVLVHATSYLLTVSRQSRDLLVRYWGWPEARIEVIPNGVDVKRFFPSPLPRSKRFIVGSVGNLRPIKNHAMILKACARLVAEGVDLEIRIAGTGDLHEELVLLGRSLGFPDRVFLLGRIENIPSFLNGLDVFVLSSDSEQHPNALNEAMACGIPSIGTRVGCVEDLLDGGRCGKVIPPGDVGALEDALRELYRNETLRETFSMNGLEHVRANYSFEVMAGRYRDLYLRAAHRRLIGTGC